MSRIALIGYGKMGKVIESIAVERGHQISFRIGRQNMSDLTKISPENTDVAIEFTSPEAAFENVMACLRQRVPVVCGSTGWLAHKAIAEQYCHEQGGAFLQASNFSIGVNIFFKINELLAKLMNPQAQYQVGLTEIHHTEKKDAPSGTAIVLAEGALKHLDRKTAWEVAPVTHPKPESILAIEAQRLPNYAGTHTIRYESAEDFIEIKHEAHNRKGFALGAVIAAEWIIGKKGVFSMQDVLGQ
jgi:4-hydroxy-tetrahydrodipicolinate reductase